jgi:hypothetical protein
MIRHTCPSCGGTLKLPDEYAGREGQCNHCGGRVTMPSLETPATNPRRKWYVLLSLCLILLIAYGVFTVPTRLSPEQRQVKNYLDDYASHAARILELEELTPGSIDWNEGWDSFMWDQENFQSDNADIMRVHETWILRVTTYRLTLEFSHKLNNRVKSSADPAETFDWIQENEAAPPLRLLEIGHQWDQAMEELRLMYNVR